MLRPRSTEVADLTDDTTAARAQHTLNKGATTAIFHNKVNADAVRKPQDLLMPLRMRAIVHGLDLGLIAELGLDLGQLLIIRGRQDEFYVSCLRVYDFYILKGLQCREGCSQTPRNSISRRRSWMGANRNSSWKNKILEYIYCFYLCQFRFSYCLMFLGKSFEIIPTGINKVQIGSEVFQWSVFV